MQTKNFLKFLIQHRLRNQTICCLQDFGPQFAHPQHETTVRIQTRCNARDKPRTLCDMANVAFHSILKGYKILELH